jgi:hypothetical protein
VIAAAFLSMVLHSWGVAQDAPAPAPTANGPATANQASPNDTSPDKTRKSEKPAAAKDEPGITEEELKQQLEGKMFYLRSGYLDNTLHFNDAGQLINSSTKASFTLNLIHIDKVHLTKNKLELQGARYGLHFLGDGPTADAFTNADKVRITPKKKLVTITIERERVVKTKKEKTGKHGKGATSPVNPSSGAQAEAAAVNPPAPSKEGNQTRANRELRTAIQTVLAPELDEKMVAAMPDFWQRYFQAMASKTDFKPSDPAVLRPNAVDRKARLLSTFEPPSNEFAQNAGVVGMAQYHVVVGPDGKAGEIAVARPIGFGLDENAVDSIRKAAFEPAMKDGKPVPVMLDLLVQFRIYSKRTESPGGTETSAVAKEAPVLPGPYSANKPAVEAPK